MGQRMVVLESTYTGYENNTGILHVSRVPPNPAVLAPGPAMLFVVVKGIPSVGVQVMIGSGQIGPQPILPIGSVPPSVMAQKNEPDLDNKVTHNSALRSDGRRVMNGWPVLWSTLLVMWTVIIYNCN